MTLAEEAQRYLAVVEFFRAQGSEPHWRSETRAARFPLRRRAAESPHSGLSRTCSPARRAPDATANHDLEEET